MINKYLSIYFFVLFVFSVSNLSLYSQKVNYCNYFSLEITELEHNNKKLKSYRPLIVTGRNDRYSKFIKSHSIRYEYILFKNLEKYKEIGEYYPDKQKIEEEFCNRVLNTPSVLSLLSSLSPEKLASWQNEPDTFSVEELMLVASRFFYCEKVNEKDTSIQSHVCVGINGIKDLYYHKDLTLLEAFSIEAILKGLHKKNPAFYNEFITYKEAISRQNKKECKDLGSYLQQIREQCYNKMQNSKALKETLLSYYRTNRDNLKFIIK